MPNYDYANGPGLTALAKRTFEKIKSKITTDVVTSEAANPLVIETDAAQYAKATHLTLAPVQDLHGYDHPWAGGAGKNLFDKDAVTVGKWLNVNTGEEETASSNAFALSDWISVKSGITYHITYTQSSRNWLYNSSKEPLSIISSEAITFTPNEDGFARFTVNTSAAQLNTIQLELGSTATSWEPYSNICPITGVDEVEVRATEKNLFDEKSFFGRASGWSESDGEYTGNSKWIADANNGYMLTDIPSGSRVTVSFDFINDTAMRAGYVYISYTDGTYSIAECKANSSSWTHRTLTSTSGKDIAKIWFGASNYVDMSIRNFQIEYGDIETAYEPYKGYTASLDLPEEVYSGTLDLETGELVVDKAYEEFSGNETNYVKQGDSNNHVGYIPLSNSAKNSDTATTASAIFDKFKTITKWYVDYVDGDGEIYNSRAYFFVPNATDATDVKNYVQSIGGFTVCYELATPKIYQLTPQQLALFKGINNISTNAKTVQVTYRNGELAATGNIVDAVEVAKQNAIGESASYTDARLATELAPILGNFATAETSPASASHAVGEYLLYNKRLFKVLAAISAGQQLTIGTNIGQTNVAAELASQASAISVLNSRKYELFNGILLGSANDLDAIKTPGNYRINNASSIPAHVPENSRGRLYVYDGMLSGDVNAICQEYITYPTSITYIRYYKTSTTSWSSWEKQPTRAEVDALNSKWIAASYYYNATEITLSGFSITDYGKSFFLFNANQNSIALIKVEKLSPEASSVTKISGGINFTISVSSNSFTLSADAKLWGETIIMYKP